MPEPKRWISRIRAVEPPDLWDEVGRRREATEDESGRREDVFARRPRLAALATGLVAGAIALALVAVALRSAPEERLRSTPSHSVGASPSPSEVPEPARLDPIVLTGDFDDPLTPWTDVATIPVGRTESEIGSPDCFHCEITVPGGLVVAEDGSFWIGDPLNGRVAHFSSDGTFLGGVATERGPADVTLVGDQIFALLEQGASKIQLIGPAGAGRVITANDGGRGMHVEALIGGQGQLLALISGAERLLGSYWAFAFVDPGTGQITPAPGLITHSGTFADLKWVDTENGPPMYELRWSNGERTTAVQDVLFEFTAGGENARVAIGDMYLRTCTRNGTATVVSVGDAQGNPVGAWFLEFSTLGREPVFERIAEEGLGIGGTRQSLTLGADGFTYRMELRDDGLHILRR